MSRHVLMTVLLFVGLAGCGGSAPTSPATTEPAVDLGAPADPTPVLPIPETLPSRDESEPPSQATIKPIPDDPAPQGAEIK